MSRKNRAFFKENFRCKEQLLLFFANHQHEDPEEVASAVSKPKQSLLVLAAAPLPCNVVTPM